MGDNGVDGFARVVGLYGQLVAEPAVDEHAELDFGGSSKIQQRVQGGPDGAACPEDVVDEDDIFVFDGKGDICLVQLMEPFPYIIPVKSYIQQPVWDRAAGQLLFQLCDNSIGEVDTSGLDADEHGIFKIQMILEHLVGQTLYRDTQLLFIQDCLQAEIFLIKIRKSKRPAEAGLLQTIQTFFKTLKQTIYLPPPNL